MWSTDFSGRYGAFSQQQRLLFPVRDSSEITKKCLLTALLRGTCTGIGILKPDDRSVLLLVRQTLQSATTKNPQLPRSNVQIVVVTSTAWAAETLSESVHNVLGHLQLDVLDVLLLSRPPMLLPPLTTSQRKQIVLQHWEAVHSIRQRGLVRKIGVSDFSIQELEFMFTATPDAPPSVLSIAAVLAPTPASTTKSTTPDVPLRAMVSFAHGRRMDVIVRLAYHALDDLSPSVSLRDQWRQLVEAIAQRQRDKQFEIQVVHEAEQEAFHLEKRDMAETSTLQSSFQIVLRYLLQKGVVVVPFPDSNDTGEHFTEDEGHDVFGDLMHPFATVSPARSPQNQYASVLSKEEVQLIDQVLPLVVSFTD